MQLDSEIEVPKLIVVAYIKGFSANLATLEEKKKTLSLFFLNN